MNVPAAKDEKVGAISGYGEVKCCTVLPNIIPNGAIIENIANKKILDLKVKEVLLICTDKAKLAAHLCAVIAKNTNHMTEEERLSPRADPAKRL